MAKKTGRSPRKKRNPAPTRPAPLAPVKALALPRVETVTLPQVEIVAATRSEPTSSDRIRTLIQDELERHHAIEKSRQPLELIAETAIRPAEEAGSPGYLVVDDAGEARTKTVDGATFPFTIADLVDELRLEHPNLFQNALATEVSSTPPSVPAPADLPVRLDLTRANVAEVAPSAPDADDEATPAPAGDNPEAKVEGPAPSVILELAAQRRRAAALAEAEPSVATAVMTPDRAPAPRAAPAGVTARRRATLLPPAWMPSRAARLRALYLVAFVAGLAAYSAVRHFA